MRAGLSVHCSQVQTHYGHMSISLGYIPYYNRSKRHQFPHYISYYIKLVLFSFYLFLRRGMAGTAKGIPIKSRAHCAA